MAIVKTKIVTNNKFCDGHIHVVDEAADFVICKSPDKLNVLINKIKPGKSIFYISDGDWSMHDLVMQLLKKYNPAEVFISTYALREYSVRQLILAIDRKEITAVNLILDYRAPIRTPAVHKMAEMNFKIFLISVHAKITIIKSPIGCISIVGSANWTKNPKIESGVISMDNNLAEWYIENMKNIMNGAKIFS